MKKTYNKPQVKVAEIENEMLLADSNPESLELIEGLPTVDNQLNQYAKKRVLDWDE